MSICKLCNKDKELVNSHILPEFLYKPLYDEEHEFNLISVKDGKITQKLNKGVYEKLLCQHCDNIIIGEYEDHAAKVLFGDGKKEIEIIKTKFGHLIRGLDYRLFKLFQISLIWRISLTTRQEFKKINLGPHQNKMRTMLLEGNPGDVFEYGVWILFFPKSSKEMKDLIIAPNLLRKRIEGHRCYRAIFNGLFWLFFVSHHTYQFSHKEYFLSKSEELPIINSGQIGENFVQYLIREYQKNREKINY